MITNYESFCAICNARAEHRHHLVFGRGIRELAETDDLTIPLCELCHRKIHEGECAKSGNREKDKYNRYAVMSKIIGQLAWEKHYIMERRGLPFDTIEEEAREAFRNRYRKSYL